MLSTFQINSANLSRFVAFEEVTGILMCVERPEWEWYSRSHSVQSRWVQVGQWADTGKIPHMVQFSVEQFNGIE